MNRSLKVRPAVLVCALLCSASLAGSQAQAIDRFGGSEKWIGFAVYGGGGVFVGRVGEQATIGFGGQIDADELYHKPQTLALEFNEIIGKTSLATGLEFTRVQERLPLANSLGLSSDAAITVSYIDIPVTYRVNAFEPGRRQWNVFAGASLVAQLDIFKAAEPVFAAETSTQDAADLSDKHVDFGLAFGGEFGVDHRITGGVYLTARAGFRSPFTGVTRPKHGFLHLGLRCFEW